eukprot:m.110493 g.110493  ORF g.110493 m.110493 type:complete len:604 (-) comp14040_c0_seq2:42-1853(-)
MRGAASALQDIATRFAPEDDNAPIRTEWMLGLSDGSDEFLDWVSDYLTTADTLTSEEITKYEKLQQSSAVLHGAKLQKALDRAKGQKRKLAAKSDRQEIESLWKQLEHDKAYLRTTKKQLAELEKALERKRQEADDMSGTRMRQIEEMDPEVSRSSSEINTHLEKLDQAIDVQHGLYQSNENQETTPFFSHDICLLQAYLASEQEYNRELSRLVRKQFHDSFLMLAASDEGPVCEKAELDAPSPAWLHGTNMTEYNENRAELQRLQNLDALTSKDAIHAKINRVQMEVFNEVIRAAIMEASDSTLQTPSTEQLRKELSETKLLLASKLTEHEAALEECYRASSRTASVQQSSVILGDYRLKLARQTYITSKQEELIDLLQQQRARQQFLMAIFESEKISHLETSKVLEGLIKYSHGLAKDSKLRISAVSEMISSEYRKKKTIHSGDASANRLTRALEMINIGMDEVPKQSLSEYGSVLKGVQKMVQSYKETESILERTIEDQTNQITSMMKKLEEYEFLVYGESKETISDWHKPALTPLEVKQRVTELQSNIDVLTSSVKRLSEHVRQQEESISVPGIPRARANIMELFHTNPTQLPAVGSTH